LSVWDVSDLRRRLASVDWRRYERGLGCEALADDLVALVEDDAPARERRLQRIEGCLLPYGGLAEIALHALPFLLELVRHGVGDGDLYRLLVPVATCAEPERPDEGIVFPGRDAALAEACLQQLAVGIPDYLRDIACAQWPVTQRSGALGVLSSLPAWREQWLLPLRVLYEDEPDPRMKAEIAAWFPDLFR
jgi:hypothetical protein